MTDIIAKELRLGRVAKRLVVGLLALTPVAFFLPAK